MKAVHLLRLPGCAALLCAVTVEIEVCGQVNNRTARPTPKAIGIPNAKPESNPPSISINFPTNGQQIGQSIIQTAFRAADDTRVEYFRCSVNGVTIGETNSGHGWYWAPGTPWPWAPSIALNPGTNTFQVDCTDYFGNGASATVAFVYVPASGLTLDIANGGEVTPNYQGQPLEAGKTYAMTA